MRTKPRTHALNCKYCSDPLDDINAHMHRSGKYMKRSGWCKACEKLRQDGQLKELLEQNDLFPPVATPLCCECAEEVDRYAERIAELRGEVNRLRAELAVVQADKKRAIAIINRLRSKPGRPRVYRPGQMESAVYLPARISAG